MKNTGKSDPTTIKWENPRSKFQTNIPGNFVLRIVWIHASCLHAAAIYQDIWDQIIDRSICSVYVHAI